VLLVAQQEEEEADEQHKEQHYNESGYEEPGAPPRAPLHNKHSCKCASAHALHSIAACQ
jgi:hypothetical protein